MESKRGRGSAFHFTVSFERASAAASAEPVPLPIQLKDLPVLIVDDNETNRMVLDEMLKHWRMQPALADGGEAALSAMRRARDAGCSFPLVLLDAHMPGMDGFAVAAQIHSDPELSGATIVMLTSDRQLGDSERCQALGIKVCLVKPIGQAELLEAISAAMGIPVVLEVEEAASASGTPPVPRPLRILLAEDNEVNLQLMLRLLKRRGHSVTIASNGNEALDRLAEFGFSAFDAALMDVQMPGMDGLEVAQEIRKQERSLGTHLPIMGVTAHAVAGYRERCLRAGMDAYVTKPIRTQELFDELDRLTSNRAPAQLPSAALDPTPATEAFDRAAALERMEGDFELLADLIQVFLQDLPQQVAALRKAVEDQDAKGIEREAHRLKGGAASLDATAVSACAARLEQSARNGNCAAARAEWVHLEAELARLELAFRDIHPEAVR